MDIKEFVDEILSLKPNEAELKGLDYPNGFIEHMLRGFEVKQLHDRPYEDSLIGLLKNYDVNSLNINDITFDPEIQEDSEYLFFGWDATGDRLALRKSDGKIIAYDVYSFKITSRCAENPDKFLDALIEIMKFVKEKMLNNYEEDQRDKRSAEVAYIASLRAGGEEYEDYYKSVLWVE